MEHSEFCDDFAQMFLKWDTLLPLKRVAVLLPTQ